MRVSRPRAILCALGVLAVSHDGHATDCAHPTDQTSLDICADQGLRDADHRLNETYQALLKTISPAGAVKLRTAEHAWLAYRDAQCAFETFSKDGSYSAEPMVRANCLNGLTGLHAKELDAQLHCQEGVIGCGLQ
jgi:uncharacterized protein YecT (DUF1311 family)